MKQYTTTHYNFNELPQYAKNMAIDKNLHINLNQEWYINVYNDIENNGLNIIKADMEKNVLKLAPMDNLMDVCNNILNNHDQDSNLYSIAYSYACKEMTDKRFITLLQIEYMDELKYAYEYLTSSDVIIATFMTYDYHFDLEGNIKGYFIPA